MRVHLIENFKKNINFSIFLDNKKYIKIIMGVAYEKILYNIFSYNIS